MVELPASVSGIMRENDIERCIRKAIDGYFRDLDGEEPSAIYDMVICCVEKPLLEVVLDKADGNQTRAAEMLGLNRNTLRKKMKQHGFK
jgi:Fis family transcriptional regulator